MDIAKLKKQVEKAQSHRDMLKTRAMDAVAAFGQAEAELGAVRNECEHAESLETARELRAKKTS